MAGFRTTLALALIACPAAVASDNAAPRILTAEVSQPRDRTVNVRVVARDRDDVVRGAEISWGDAQPALGLSACEQSSSRRAERRRRGRRERFKLAHEYAAPGVYTVTVRVLSGGCGKRPQQRSAARTLIVTVE